MSQRRAVRRRIVLATVLGSVVAYAGTVSAASMPAPAAPLSGIVPSLTRTAGKPAPKPKPKATPAVKLLWRQEFNDKTGRSAAVQRESLTPAAGQVWQAEISGAGGGNRERQFYTDGPVEYTSRGSVAHYAVELDGKGNLAINARRVLPRKGARPSNAPEGACWYGACEFVSGRINTRGTVGFKYGLLEARIKVPNAWNSWPAFWMLGANIGEVDWPACGEIDIMESAANGAKYWTYFGTLHSLPDDGFGVGSGARYLEDLYTKFHVFGVYWDKTKVQWRIDGKPYFTATKKSVTGSDWLVGGVPRSWPFDQEMFAILNVAMGGTLGGDAGGYAEPDSTGGTMLVDWVRFSSVNGIGRVVKHSTAAGK